MEDLKKRKKLSKKKEPRVQEEVNIPPIASSKELAVTEVPTMPVGVQEEAKMTTMSTEVQNVAEASVGQGSPSWSIEASQPTADTPIPEANEGEEF